jgi:hypothetical protein
MFAFLSSSRSYATTNQKITMMRFSMSLSSSFSSHKELCCNKKKQWHVIIVLLLFALWVVLQQKNAHVIILFAELRCSKTKQMSMCSNLLQSSSSSQCELHCIKKKCSCCCPLCGVALEQNKKHRRHALTCCHCHHLPPFLFVNCLVT